MRVPSAATVSSSITWPRPHMSLLKFSLCLTHVFNQASMLSQRTLYFSFETFINVCDYTFVWLFNFSLPYWTIRILRAYVWWPAYSKHSTNDVKLMKSWFWHLLTMWFWTSHLPSLSFSFLIGKHGQWSHNLYILFELLLQKHFAKWKVPFKFKISSL